MLGIATQLLQKLASKARNVQRRAKPRHVGPVRLTFVQYGDYADAFQRIQAGDGGNYYAQEYTVAHVGALSDRDNVESVSVVNFAKDQSPTVLSNGVESSGVELYPPGKPNRHDALLAAVARTSPTHLIVADPLVPLLR